MKERYENYFALFFQAVILIAGTGGSFKYRTSKIFCLKERYENYFALFFQAVIFMCIKGDLFVYI
ncbi:hypothetical protein ACS51_06705 [Bacillus cereus]|nr:hypothetical protein ACS51_06705 [Bacillus cereus]